MIVMSLVAVMTWDALSLDPRDTAIFGPLPIERGVIVRAKLRAVGILAGGFALVISGMSSLFHPTLMVAKLPIGMIPALALIVIHLAVMLAAGLFAFASVVLLREVLRALLGMRFITDFSRTTGGDDRGAGDELSAAPCDSESGRTTRAARRRGCCRRSGSSACTRRSPGRWSPNCRRGELPTSIARQEDRAAARYREIATSIRPLAWRAVTALTHVTGVAIAAFFWNSRQLPLPLVGNRAGALPRSRPLHPRDDAHARAAAGDAGRVLLHPAVPFPQRPAPSGDGRLHRRVDRAGNGVPGRGQPFAARRPVGACPVYVFSTQTIVLVVLLGGFRHVTRLPADIRANRLFRLAWVADSGRFLAGVRRGAVAGIVLPAIVLLLPPYFYLLGTRLALMHALTGFLLGTALDIPDDVQDEPAAVRRQLRSGNRREHGRTGRPDRRPDRRLDLLVDRAARAGRRRIRRDLLGHPGGGRRAPATRRRPQHAARSADRLRRACARNDAAGFGVTSARSRWQLPDSPGDTNVQDESTRRGHSVHLHVARPIPPRK